MGPKIEAACDLLQGGGDSVLISSMEHLAAALRGEIGTRIERISSSTRSPEHEEANP